MSEHTKKRRTSTKAKSAKSRSSRSKGIAMSGASPSHTSTKSKKQLILFEGPSEKSKTAIRTMKKHGYRVKENWDSSNNEFIPWREAFPDMKDEDMAGRSLRGARVKEGLTQVQLSERTGIPQAHISAMENGKRQIGLKHAKLFGQILNIDYRLFL